MYLGRGISFKLCQAVDQTDFLVVVTPMTLGICWLFVRNHFGFWSLLISQVTPAAQLLFEGQKQRIQILYAKTKTCDV